LTLYNLESNGALTLVPLGNWNLPEFLSLHNFRNFRKMDINIGDGKSTLKKHKNIGKDGLKVLLKSF
jgi:hypothetical protein